MWRWRNFLKRVGEAAGFRAGTSESLSKPLHQLATRSEPLLSSWLFAPSHHQLVRQQPGLPDSLAAAESPRRGHKE